MKYIKKFESISEQNDDIKVIIDIINNETYDNLYLLKKEIQKIKDKKLISGLLIELFIRYDVDKEEVFNIFDELDLNKSMELHKYYIDKISDDVRMIFLSYLESGEDVSENQEFIEWIKSISNEDLEKIEDYCIDSEIYELIPFIRKSR